MKTSLPLITVAAALSLCANTALRAQAVAGGSIPASPEVREMEKAPAEAQRAQTEAQKQMAQAQRQFAQASEQFEEQNQQFQRAMPVYQDRLRSIVARASGGSGGTLVVRSTETDPKEQAANLEEDLAIMSRVLSKAVAEKASDEQGGPRVMGISVFLGPGAVSFRNLYLEGYGALLTLNVNFPLLAPPAKSGEQKEKPSADSAWQEARQELFGQSPGAGTSPQVGEEYSEEKVSRLKDALLDALKDATNIRNLKPDDSITVCVFGAPLLEQRVKAKTTGATASAATPALGDLTVYGRLFRAMPAGRTMMTIRVKKSDVDAFAKGKLNLDEFRKKASIAAYISSGGGNEGGFGGGSGGPGGGFGGSGFGGGFGANPFAD